MDHDHRPLPELISPIRDGRQVGVVALCEEGRDVGFGPRQEVFLCDCGDCGMAERTPGVEGKG